MESAGDVNGDGLDDVIVGRHPLVSGTVAPAGSTAAVVAFGSTSFAIVDAATMTADQGFRVWPSGDSDGSGNVVDGAGDVNHDGFDDVIVASPFATANDRPVAHVILGRAHPSDVDLAAFSAADGWTIRGTTALGNVLSVSRAGDVNGDGYDDLLISFAASPHGRTDAGSVFLVYGAQTHADVDLATAALPGVVRFDGAAMSVDLGSDLASGDINADGRPDLVIRSARAAGGATGSLAVVWGRAGLGNIDLAAPPAGALVQVPVEPIDPTGDATTMAVADVNGDGRPDVAVGETGYQKTGDTSPRGSVLVLLGATAFPSGSWRIIGVPGGLLGSWVAARDIDGDHRAEIAATAQGAVYVVRGRSATSPLDLSVNNAAAWTVNNGETSTQFFQWGTGLAVTDVTGDRVPDLLIGSPVDLMRAGRVYVFPDTLPPIATTPTYALVTGHALASGLIPTRVGWTASDESGLARYELSQATDGGNFFVVSTTLTFPAIYLNLAAGHIYRFRVRAIDNAGNVGPWAYGATFRLTGIQQSSSAIHYVGTWTTSTSTTWWGGTAKGSTMQGATASYTFTGRSIAWVGLKAYNRGKAQVYVNGVLKATIDLYSLTLVKQTFVWTANYTTQATRTILIKVLGTSGRPKIDIDGFVVRS